MDMQQIICMKTTVRIVKNVSVKVEMSLCVSNHPWFAGNLSDSWRSRSRPLLVSRWERAGRERLNVTFIISPLCAHHAIRVLILFPLQLSRAVSPPLCPCSPLQIGVLVFTDISLKQRSTGAKTSMKVKEMREEVTKTMKPHSVAAD